MQRSGKPIIGILGGICSGKTTVAKMFGKLGCSVIDADRIAHRLLKRKSVKNKIIKTFGNKITDGDGNIDRKKLGEVVFGDKDKISQLNAVIHPPILKKVDELIKKSNKDPETKAVVLDMPLLLEVGWKDRCDTLIFVDSSPKKRFQRAKMMGLATRKKIKQMENLQISLDNKKKIADNTIANNSDLSALPGQVSDIFSNIMDKSGC